MSEEKNTVVTELFVNTDANTDVNTEANTDANTDVNTKSEDNGLVSVTDFCKAVDEVHSSDEVKGLIKDVIATGYMPVLLKKELVQSTISGARKDEDNLFILDSHQRYIGFIACIVCGYTKLDFAGRNGGSMFENYDMLQSRGLIQMIMDGIDGMNHDIQEFTNIYNMMWDDFLENEKSPMVMVMRFLNGLVELTKEENFAEALKKLGEIADKLPGEDE